MNGVDAAKIDSLKSSLERINSKLSEKKNRSPDVDKFYRLHKQILLNYASSKMLLQRCDQLAALDSQMHSGVYTLFPTGKGNAPYSVHCDVAKSGVKTTVLSEVAFAKYVLDNKTVPIRSLESEFKLLRGNQDFGHTVGKADGDAWVIQGNEGAGTVAANEIKGLPMFHLQMDIYIEASVASSGAVGKTAAKTAAPQKNVTIGVFDQVTKQLIASEVLNEGDLIKGFKGYVALYFSLDKLSPRAIALGISTTGGVKIRLDKVVVYPDFYPPVMANGSRMAWSNSSKWAPDNSGASGSGKSMGSSGSGSSSPQRSANGPIKASQPAPAPVAVPVPPAPSPLMAKLSELAEKAKMLEAKAKAEADAKARAKEEAAAKAQAAAAAAKKQPPKKEAASRPK